MEAPRTHFPSWDALLPFKLLARFGSTAQQHAPHTNRAASPVLPQPRVGTPQKYFPKHKDVNIVLQHDLFSSLCCRGRHVIGSRENQLLTVSVCVFRTIHLDLISMMLTRFVSFKWY